MQFRKLCAKKIMRGVLACVLAAAFAAAAAGCGTSDESGDAAAGSETAAEDVSAAAEDSEDAEASAEEAAADVFLYVEEAAEAPVSMLFENTTGSEIVKVEVRNAVDAADELETDETYAAVWIYEEDAPSGMEAESDADVYGDVSWAADAAAQIYAADAAAVETEGSEEENGAVTAAVDIRITFADGEKSVLHAVGFDEAQTVRVCLDADSGLAYLSYETEDGTTVETLKEETAARKTIRKARKAAKEAEEAAAAEAEEEAAAEEAEEETSDSADSEYDTGSSSDSGSASAGQSEEQCVDDLILN